MVPRRDTVYTRARFDNYTGTLVAKDGRKQPFGVITRKRKSVGMADTGGFNFNHNLAFAGPVHVNCLDTERLTCCMSNCGTTGYHNSAPLPCNLDYVNPIIPTPADVQVRRILACQQRCSDTIRGDGVQHAAIAAGPVRHGCRSGSLKDRHVPAASGH